MGEVPTSSPLAGLRRRVDEARRQATIDWPLQLGEVELLLRYRAVDFETIEKITGKQSGPRGRVGLEQAARLLARSCVGVYAVVGSDIVSIDGVDDPSQASARINGEGQVEGEPVTFASEWLADELGVESGKAADTVIALFPLELTIPEHARVVIDFSQGKDETAIRAALGN